MLAGSAAAQSTTPAPAPQAASTPAPPTPKLAWVGQVLMPVTARTAPRKSAKARTVLRPIAPMGKGPVSLLITRTVVKEGVRWVEVLLPIRPNGSRGWVPTDVLRLRTTPLRIVIDVSQRRLTLFRGNRPAMRAPVAVGRPGTETPVSRDFAIAELIPTYDPGGFLGPIVFPITGYSERLFTFAGGDGRVGIHGTSLPGLIGTAVSNGCIRMYNRDIVRLSRLVRPGTPLTIRS